MEIKDLNRYGEVLETSLKLRTMPIGVKFCESEADVPKEAVYPKEKFGKHMALCQAFSYARMKGMTIAMRKEDHWCWNPIITYGYIDKELGKEGFRAIARAYNTSSESGEAFVEGFPSLPTGEYRGILVSPLDKADFQPDVTMIYCKNDQLRLLLMAVDTQTHKLLDTSPSPIPATGSGPGPTTTKSSSPCPPRRWTPSCRPLRA